VLLLKYITITITFNHNFLSIQCKSASCHFQR